MGNTFFQVECLLVCYATCIRPDHYSMLGMDNLLAQQFSQKLNLQAFSDITFLFIKKATYNPMFFFFLFFFLNF